MTSFLKKLAFFTGLTLAPSAYQGIKSYLGDLATEQGHLGDIARGIIQFSSGLYGGASDAVQSLFNSAPKQTQKLIKQVVSSVIQVLPYDLQEPAYQFFLQNIDNPDAWAESLQRGQIDTNIVAQLLIKGAQQQLQQSMDNQNTQQDLQNQQIMQTPIQPLENQNIPIQGDTNLGMTSTLLNPGSQMQKAASRSLMGGDKGKLNYLPKQGAVPVLKSDGSYGYNLSDMQRVDQQNTKPYYQKLVPGDYQFADPNPNDYLYNPVKDDANPFGESGFEGGQFLQNPQTQQPQQYLRTRQ